MPLQALKFRPGISRDNTTLANEGGWYECDKVRFRNGFPEKIGGWDKDSGTTSFAPSTGTFWGVCRALWGWIRLSGANLLGLGTNLKYYIQNGANGTFYDITPLRDAPGFDQALPTNPFEVTDGSSVITVTHTAHGAVDNDFVTFSSATGFGGNITADVLNAEHQITYVDANTYTITVSVVADSTDDPAGTGTSGGGASVTGQYQINTGNAIYSVATGWGAGGWGGSTPGFAATGWGESAAVGVGVDMRLWSHSNFGEYLLINPRGGGIYLWVTAASASVYNRAQILSSTNTNTATNSLGVTAAFWQTDTACPSKCNIVHVSDSSRFVIAFGCNDVGSTDLNPLLVRWSDQEDYATWTPTATNQAGSFSLSSGSEIIAIKPQRQEILVFTDAAVYSMQYQGPPYVWGFQQVGTNISIISQNAVANAANLAFWMGVDKFYVYDGRVQTLPCPLRRFIFNDLNRNQGSQVFAGTNEGFNEIWWFYCSANSTTVDSYVIFNYQEKAWSYGTMSRTAWLDSPLREYPMATGQDNSLYYHESGVDDGSTNPPSAIASYIQSSDFDIGEGHKYGFVWRMLPDITFNGSTASAPKVTLTSRPRQNPGAPYGTSSSPTVTSDQDYSGQRNYDVQEYTETVNVRVRGRQMAFKISSSDVGTAWQLGVPRIDIRQDGRR